MSMRSVTAENLYLHVAIHQKLQSELVKLVFQNIHLFVSPANAGWFLRVIFSERMTTRQLKIRKVDYTPEPEKWMVWKMLFLFQGCILSFHVNFPGV